MAEILLVNPRKRRKRRTGARRKLSALQQKYFGKRRKRTTRSRRRATPAAVAPRRRRRRSAARLSNPRRRRRRIITQSFRTIRRRRRSNPSLRGGLSGLPRTGISLLKSGGVGALGALGLDMVWGYSREALPASIAGSPLAQYALKLLGAIAVGWVGEKVLRGRGRELAVGATTVVLHDALKAQVAASFPSIKLGEYLTFAPAEGVMDRAGRLLSTGGMGEYLSGLPQGVGYPEDSSGYYGDGNGDFTGDGLSG
jgi:hypothetical protein